MNLRIAWLKAACTATALASALACLCLAHVAGVAAQGAAPMPEPKQKQDSPPAADDKSGKAPRTRPQLKAPGASIPENPAMRARLKRDLYALLAAAQDQESATTIANSIERLWIAGVGDTAQVLMERAAKSAAADRPDLALRMLDTVTRIAPDFAEGFNRRAYVYYSMNEFERALGDLRRVLALDPNHYKALDGLGQILRELGQKKAALEVYRRLNAVHPYWPGVKATLDELERTVAGQGT